jgi:hypothetical protein
MEGGIMPVEASTSGLLPRDENGAALQTGRTAVFQDGAATPVVSPKTNVAAGTPQAFRVPTGAVQMIFSTTGACRYGTNADLDGTAANKGFKRADVGGDIVFDCAGVTDVYIRGDAAAVDIDFYFKTV